MAGDLRSTMERVGDRFNLGEYEIDAYLAVLEHGQLTAGEIADYTEIPQPRVYDTVRSLSDRGLVELRESRPMTVVAIDPGESFADVTDALEAMVSQLESRYTAPARETEAVSLVKSRSTILRYFEEVIDDADYELTLSLTPDLLQRFEAHLAETSEAGVAIELLVTPDAEAPPVDQFDYGRLCRVARTRRGITTPVMAVADGQFSIYATQDALRDDQDRYGVIFNRSALGFLVSGFFGTVLWTTCERTLYEDDAVTEFPRRYASIRRCVKDLRGRDGAFFASIEGRDVEHGTPRVVQGRIADIVFDESEEVAGLRVRTDDGDVRVGGLVAAYEDVEAHEIRIGRESPPPIE